MTSARIVLAALACALLLAPAARAAPPCEELAAVVSDLPTGDSGIGGSGRGDDSGIGGTGIYGAITGFDSVCVNGLRVHFGPGVAVDLNGAPATPKELAIGQVVWITARAREGRLEAGTISVQSTLIGPLSAVDAGARRLEVLGRRVWLPEDAQLVDATGQPIGALAGLAPGDSLDVHGLRRPDGVIVATRIVRRAASGPLLDRAPDLAGLLRESPGVRAVFLSGYAAVAQPGAFQVGGLPIGYAPVAGAAPLASGDAIRVFGAVSAHGAVRAERISVLPPPGGGAGSPNLPPLPDAAPLGPQSQNPSGLGASDRPQLFEEPAPTPAPTTEPILTPAPTPEPIVEPQPTPVRPVPVAPGGTVLEPSVIEPREPVLIEDGNP